LKEFFRHSSGWPLQSKSNQIKPNQTIEHRIRKRSQIQRSPRTSRCLPREKRALTVDDMDLTTIYLICFGVGLGFAIASALLAHSFGGHDTQGGHSEGGLTSHHVPGFSPFSPTAIASFITAFGGFGLIFSSMAATRSGWLSAPLAALGGLVVAALVVIGFNKVFRATQGSSEGRVAELFGQSATVITPIAASGVGEIAYVQGGTRYTASARSLDETAIPSGTAVRIVRVSGSQFYVASA
jgi:membrane protein implicated in regulation of membrane protease activity